MNRFRCIAVSMFTLLAFCGCAEDGSLLGDGGGTTQPNLASIQETVFTPRCAVCHGPGGVHAMHLNTKETSHADLVGIDSDACVGLPRVEPDEPDDSCLVLKLEDAGGFTGVPMPKDSSPLDSLEIEAIRLWILDGAPLNDPDEVLPTLASIQEKIFTPTCAYAGCHTASHPLGVDLTSEGTSHSTLVDVLSSLCGNDRVEPGVPDASCLVWKLEGPDAGWFYNGYQMPRGDNPVSPNPLSPEQIAAIRGWIQDGALP
jgi:hypothetical protein